MRRDSHSFKGYSTRVVGIGCVGIEAVDSMILAGLKDIQFISIGSEPQILADSNAPTQILIGKSLPQTNYSLDSGLMGEQVVAEAEEEIGNALKGARVLYITAGLGSQTGSDAASAIAKFTRELGIFTIAVVTVPARSEGYESTQFAKKAIKELDTFVDYLVVLPTDRLTAVSPYQTDINETYHIFSDLLCRSVQAINEFVNYNGLINLDLADFKNIMKNRGTTLVTVGRAGGNDRSRTAAERALFCPSLGLSIHGARGLLVNIRASGSFNLQETKTITQIIKNSTFPGAEFILGIIIDEAMGEEIQISVIATGFFNDNWEMGADYDEQLGIRTLEPVVTRYAEAPKFTASRVPKRKRSPGFSLNKLPIPAFLRG